MHPIRRLTVFLLALPAALFLFAIFALPAFAQGTDAPTVTLTPEFVVTSLIGIVAGFVSMAVNTGKILGIKTVPKPYLPYLALAGSFVTAFGVSLGTHPLTALYVYMAALAGVGALMSSGGGAALHGLVTAHLSSRGVEATDEAAAAAPPSPLVLTPSSAVTKPDAVKITEKLGPLTCLMLVVSFGLASVGANCNGTITPATQADINAGLQLAACVENTYATDSAETPPASAIQIAIDEGTKCGADAADLLILFGSSVVAGKSAVAQAAQANAPAVHAAAMAHQGH